MKSLIDLFKERIKTRKVTTKTFDYVERQIDRDLVSQLARTGQTSNVSNILRSEVIEVVDGDRSVNIKLFNCCY